MTESVPTDFRPDHIFKVRNRDGTETTYTILDHPIKELSALALVDNVAYICAYFPSEVTYTKEINKVKIVTTDWVNRGYFVYHDYNKPFPISKKKIPIDDEGLRSLYKVKVKPEWNERWSHDDMLSWKNSDAKTDPKMLLTLMHDIITKYVELETEASYYVLYLWIIGTYFHRLFGAYPYLDFIGTKRAGKTKTLEIINLIAFNSIMSPDVTGSVIFRLIEQTCGTIVLDEAEHFKNPKSEQAQQVRTILNQGFKKNMFAYRAESKEKDFVPVSFNIYSPKAFGHINSFDDILEDRCIQVLMKRTANKGIKNSQPWEADRVWWDIRDLCYRLFLDYAGTIETMKQKAEETMPVSGRERELWLPLLTMAHLFEICGLPGIVEKVKQFATKSSEERQASDEADSIDTKVVRYLMENLEEDNWYKNRALYDDIAQKVESYDLPKDLNMRGMSTILRRLGIKRKKSNDGLRWIITKGDVLRLRQTYLGEDVLDNSASPSVTQAQTTNDDNSDGTKNESSPLPSLSSSPMTQAQSDASDGISDKITYTMTNRDEVLPSPSVTPIVEERNTSFNINSSWVSDKSQIESDSLYICTTCDNAGPFRGTDEAKSCGNIVNYHLKLGHKVMRV